MFKRIVSNLPFSPTLINELGFYAKRLKKEEATRKLGLFLTVIALIVQSFTVFSPPESANAAHVSDIVYGGIHSRSALISAWDNNTQGFRELMEYLGVSRAGLESASEGQIHSRVNSGDAGWMSWGRISHGNPSYPESYLRIGSQDIYIRSLAGFDRINTTGSGSWYNVFFTTNNLGEEVVIMKHCGNIAMKKVPGKPISVCDLNSRTIVNIREDQFDGSRHSYNVDDCAPKPVAQCDNLTAEKISRTEVKLSAKASTADGATVNSYTFVIKDESGKEVVRETVASQESSATLQRELADGSYSAEVIVSTSLGDKTDTACQAQFTVEPIERCHLNPELPIDHPDCQPCPSDPNLWVKDEECSAKVVRSKQAANLTQDIDATTASAKAGDRIEYTLTAINEGKADATFELKDNLRDSLEYAEIFDYGGGTLDDQSKDLSWGEVVLKPGEKQARTYILKMSEQISTMPRGSSWPNSYDCIMSNTFGNTTEIMVECPAPKVIEQVVPELPQTGPTENMIAGGIVVAVVTFLYMRSRQLNKEVRLIRREVTAGSI